MLKSIMPEVVMLSARVQQALDREIAAYFRHKRDGEIQAAWIALERAHILSQSALVPHLHTHWLMLRFAVDQRDWREVAGQSLRLALAPVGHLIGRIPVGNTGRARVSAFAPMPLPDDIAPLLGADQ